ncbi:hypothetical protein FRC03_004970 [Tulasnella sp. 419]|nr:hypothetical protein FRC02_003524 [Tulasnella sp. 418]KAG8969003.1 hypothetical protein FRC03_004970 [Tulasnella sp. 419]
MATSTAPAIVVPVGPSPEYTASREALLKHHGIRGYQLASALAPPVYIVATLVRRKPFAINGMLRTTWLGAASGAVAGVGYGTVKYNEVDESKVTAERIKLAYDKNAIQMNDHSLIGAIIMGALTPAIFYNRTRLVHSVLGGASLGAAAGLATHFYKSYKDGEAEKKRIYAQTVGR